MAHAAFLKRKSHGWCAVPKGLRGWGIKNSPCRNKMRAANCKKKKKGAFNRGLNDINNLSHTKRNCKYYIVFAPKYKREIVCYEKREAVGRILWQWREWKDVNIIQAEGCPNHIYMLQKCHLKQQHQISWDMWKEKAAPECRNSLERCDRSMWAASFSAKDIMQIRQGRMQEG